MAVIFDFRLMRYRTYLHISFINIRYRFSLRIAYACRRICALQRCVVYKLPLVSQCDVIDTIFCFTLFAFVAQHAQRHVWLVTDTFKYVTSKNIKA